MITTIQDFFYSHSVFFNTMAATAIVIAALVTFYLLVVFIKTWIQEKSFSTATDKLGVAIVNVGKMILSFFAGIISVITFIFRPIYDFFIKPIPFRNLAEFFIWFAGADLDIIRTTPTGTQVKRAGFGFLMFVAVSISAIFACRMWGDIFASPKAGVCIGILWFNIIWALDRSIVQYMDGNGKRMFVAIARLLMVSAVSFMNTTFISMEIFRTEIMEIISAQKQGHLNHLNDSISQIVTAKEDERTKLSDAVLVANSAYASYIGTFEADIQKQKDIIRARKDSLIGEIEGIVGSFKRGDGEAAKAKREMLALDETALAEMQARFDSTRYSGPQYLALMDAKAKLEKRDAELVIEITSQKSDLQVAENKITNEKTDGYSHRYLALYVVARKTPFLLGMVFLFFFVFEALVVLIKLMANKDNYDEEIALQKEVHSVDHQQAKQLRVKTTTVTHENNMDLQKNIAVENLAKNQVARNIHLNAMNQANGDMLRSLKTQLDNVDEEIPNLPADIKESIQKEITKNFLNQVMN